MHLTLLRIHRTHQRTSKARQHPKLVAITRGAVAIVVEIAAFHTRAMSLMIDAAAAAAGAVAVTQ